jgi:hypothetical protein
VKKEKTASGKTSRVEGDKRQKKDSISITYYAIFLYSSITRYKFFVSTCSIIPQSLTDFDFCYKYKFGFQV